MQILTEIQHIRHDSVDFRQNDIESKVNGTSGQKNHSTHTMNVTGARAEPGRLGHRAGGWAEGGAPEFNPQACIGRRGRRGITGQTAGQQG